MTPTYYQHARIFEAARDAMWSPSFDPDRGLELMAAVADELQKRNEPLTDDVVEAAIATVMERFGVTPDARVVPRFRHDA